MVVFFDWTNENKTKMGTDDEDDLFMDSFDADLVQVYRDGYEWLVALLIAYNDSLLTVVVF